MFALAQRLVRFLKQDGPSAAEYAIMLVPIIVARVGAVATLGSNADNTFGNVGTRATTGDS